MRTNVKPSLQTLHAARTTVKPAASNVLIGAAILSLFGLLSVSTSSAAVEIPGELVEVPPAPARDDSPVGLFDDVESAVIVRLGSLAEDRASDLEALREWNRRGKEPLQGGLVRPVDRVVVPLNEIWPARPLDSSDRRGRAFRVGRTIYWGGWVVVEAAYGLRVRLDNVVAPKGAEAWVGTADGSLLGPVDLGRLDSEGGLWLPPVYSGEMLIQVAFPDDAEMSDASSFEIRRIAELVDVEHPDTIEDCRIDPACVESPANSIATYSKAVARIGYISGGVNLGWCSGALLNDSDPGSMRPLFLTANHCIDTADEASSAVFSFDYRSSTCGGPAPLLSSVPTVYGAHLLNNSPSTDFSLLELNSLPGGTRYFFGVTDAAQAAGVILRRISHPLGSRQAYSTHLLRAGQYMACTATFPAFYYSTPDSGAVAGGSSGSPVFESNGNVVGQLLGVCGTDTDPCIYGGWSNVDGWMGYTYPSISSFLQGPANQVTVSVVDASGSEGDSPWIEFMLSRSGPTTDALDVHVGWGGTADFGTDYSSPFESVVTIPAGSSTRSVTVAVVDDALTEGPETVTLRLLTDGWYGYSVGIPSSAAAGIVDDEPYLFIDRFESGDVSGWSSSNGYEP